MEFFKQNVSLLGTYNDQEVYIFYIYGDINTGLCRIQNEDGTTEVVELNEIEDIQDYVAPTMDDIFNEMLNDYEHD